LQTPKLIEREIFNDFDLRKAVKRHVGLKTDWEENYTGNLYVYEGSEASHISHSSLKSITL